MAQAVETAALPRGGAAPGDEPTTRCRIIATAERFFREIGYRKTTVADIAKALRMSPANVYRFFDSKTAINEAVADRLIGDVEAEVAAVADRPGVSASERLRDVLVLMNQLSTERFTANRRLHEMVEVAMTESWPIIHRHIERVDELFQRIVAEGVASGEFRVADPLVAARCIHAAAIRFMHPALIVQCAEEPGPTLDQLIDFMLAALRGPDPA